MQREAARREREAAGIDNDDRGDSPLNALHDEPVPNPSAAVQPPGEALEVETTLINQVVLKIIPRALRISTWCLAKKCLGQHRFVNGATGDTVSRTDFAAS